eukprot:CAMPEP_0201599198 /NCGR_PEP_ID=MMETSP0492-20130828/752_1 /ASSEMBLY_ACC=CAM_ASM_000837 /TAXON_ID=420259 /ORGANISM="Thalassiosira gravida, Strain GMp14c1" /LENGTH=875 /DNA_ID=CAMNT_0048061747 /DNA_START=60 /DNA_END=2687 /DNA_ORIENTATION=-
MATDNNNAPTRNLNRLEATEAEEGDTNDARTTETKRTAMDSHEIFMEEEEEEIADDTTATAATATITTIAKQGDLIGHHHPPKNNSHNTERQQPLPGRAVDDAANADFSNTKSSNRLTESYLERNTWAGGGGNSENNTSLPIAATATATATGENKRWSIVTNVSRATDNDTTMRNTVAGDGSSTTSNILSRVRLNFDIMLRTMHLSEHDIVDVVATTPATTTPTPPPRGHDTIATTTTTTTHEGRGEGGRTALTRMVATIFPHVTAEPVTATLVVEGEEGENDDDVVFAERVSDASRSCFQLRWKVFVCSTCFLLVVLAVLLLALAMVLLMGTQGGSLVSDVPTMEPSAPPSYDPKSTLEIVRERGYVRCGLRNESGNGFRIDLCRAVAAVIFGDPARFVGVSVTPSTRFVQLNDRAVDLLLFGDTHTIEREVNERLTGAGFTFSSPYNYDGMAYSGDESFVKCAEEGKRFDECASLLICASEGSTSLDFVQSSFPYNFIVVGDSNQENEKRRSNGTCNVIADDRSFLLDRVTPGNETTNNGDANVVIVGDKFFTKEPLAIVTRNNDREFSDIINWVLHALFYGEEQGLTKKPSLCQNYTNLTSHSASDLKFMNAVYCMGNYGKLFVEDENNRGMNRINNGTTGMLYATPFGRLKNGNDNLSGFAAGDTLLDRIRKKGSLNCGVVVSEDFDGNIMKSDNLVGMSVDYCRALAAGLFNGYSEVVNWSTFSENDTSAFASLDNGTIDVLAGGRVEKKYDFKSSSSLRGFQFSTPYYFGNETAGDDVSFFSLVTREDDVLFTSFVNIIVLATIYAQEKGTKREKSKEIWWIRDAIAYSGSYDALYTKNFGNVLEGDRGRNALNKQGGPQLHSFPGLAP